MPDTTIKVLLLVGGPHHDRPGARDALRAAIEAGAPPGWAFDLEMTDDLSVLETGSLGRADVVANYTTSQQLTPRQAGALLGSVEGGTGFAGIHGATVTFRETEDYNALVGSLFLRHPRFGEVGVRITDADHPITRGLSDFSVPDELYVIQSVGGDFGRYRVLATAEATHREDPAEMRDGVQPSTYVKSFGKGRVFYTGLGHDQRCFDSAHFRTIVGRGIVWAAGRDAAL
jgi:type 1 glutamine amidotransferase